MIRDAQECIKVDIFGIRLGTLSRGGSHRSPLSERLEQARTFSTSLASYS